MLIDLMYPKRMPVTEVNAETNVVRERGLRAPPAYQRTCLMPPGSRTEMGGRSAWFQKVLQVQKKDFEVLINAS